MEQPSIIQPWVQFLPLQQQSVLLLACRGADGFPKHHGSKPIVRAIRGSVILAAYLGRPLRLGEAPDSFMDMRTLADEVLWRGVLREWDDVVDALPLHFFQHVACAAGLLRQHPEVEVCRRWKHFYASCCAYMHMGEESPDTMSDRLSDRNRRGWGE